MNHPPILETERLILRPLEISDSETVMALAGTKEVYRTTLLIPHPYQPGMAEKWIAAHPSQFYNDEGVTLAITLRLEKKLIGAIGLKITKEHHRAELGYWIGHEYWNKGYCTEAAAAVVTYGFNTRNLHKICANHFESNPASGRVMTKIGMTREGRLVDEICKDGQYHTLIVYGIVKGKDGC
ncbi:MAG: GNAT family N-acetyltransferase [Pseudomonadota bacterium]